MLGRPGSPSRRWELWQLVGMPGLGSRPPVSGERAKSPWGWWGTPPGLSRPITWEGGERGEGLSDHQYHNQLHQVKCVYRNKEFGFGQVVAHRGDVQDNILMI